MGRLENFPNRLRGGDSTRLEDQATASLTVTRRQLYTVVMSAKDIIHDAVKNALIKDGWHITNDPLTIVYEDATVFADLGAERIIAAERGTERIAVEIKSFVGVSALHELEIALGQYILYLNLLAETDPMRKLYVAISDVVYETIFQRPSFLFMRERVQMPLIVTDVEQEVILKWIN
jgi:hypothetical protein